MAASSAGGMRFRQRIGCAINSGESSITLAAGMKGNFRERTQENPAGLPGKGKTRGAS